MWMLPDAGRERCLKLFARRLAFLARPRSSSRKLALFQLAALNLSPLLITFPVPLPQLSLQWIKKGPIKALVTTCKLS